MDEDSEVKVSVSDSDSESDIKKQQKPAVTIEENDLNSPPPKPNAEIERKGSIKEIAEIQPTIQKNESDNDDIEIGPRIIDSDEDQEKGTEKLPLRREAAAIMQVDVQDNLTSIDEVSGNFVSTEAEPALLHPYTTPIVQQDKVQKPQTKTCLLI